MYSLSFFVSLVLSLPALTAASQHSVQAGLAPKQVRQPGCTAATGESITANKTTVVGPRPREIEPDAMFEMPHGFPCPKDRINAPKKPGVKIESWSCFGPIPISHPSEQRASSKSTPKCSGGIVPEQPNNSVHALSVLRKCAQSSERAQKKLPNRVTGPR